MIKVIYLSFTDDGLEALKRHLWPGNIRELKNVIERAYILFAEQEIKRNHVLENLIRLKIPTSERRAKCSMMLLKICMLKNKDNKKKKIKSPSSSSQTLCRLV